MARSLDEIKQDQAAVDAKLADWRVRVTAARDTPQEAAIRNERSALLEQSANYQREANAITNNPATDKYAGTDPNTGLPTYVNSEGKVYRTATRQTPTLCQKHSRQLKKRNIQK